MGKEQKVAIITGASQGIGAGSGQGVIATATIASSPIRARSSRPAIRTSWRLRGDIADPATAQRIVAQALARFGRIDTLVNNAGIFIAKPFTDYTEEDFASVLAINLGGFFHLTQARRGRDAEAGLGPHRAASRPASSTTPTATCRRCSPRSPRAA